MRLCDRCRLISFFHFLYKNVARRNLGNSSLSTNMATSYQPLLDNPATPKHYCRTLFTFLSIAAIISTATLVSINLINPTSSNLSSFSWVCDKAHNKQSCLSFVSELASHQEDKKHLKNEVELLQMFLMKSLPEIAKVQGRAAFLRRQINGPRHQAALLDCMELMDQSTMRIKSSSSALEKRTSASNKDAHAWLSTVLTNHVTCLDGLSGPARPNMEEDLRGLISRASASLAMLVATTASVQEDIFKPLVDKFPSWITSHDRKLLETSPGNINADVTVATDGSGKYKTVAEAVAAAPTNSKTRYTIYVKKGTYKENVQIASNKKNLMLVGDGMDKTIITGSLNVVDGSTTFNSATVAAVGDSFIAQDIWFQNTAGAAKHQAVALRVGSDMSVINRCKIDAYQDTLYAHSNRQFYRDSYITGTVDFIFGNAAVVFQNCKLVPRKPMSGQSNMVTAQGRTDPNQNTGTSIQSCDIISSSDLEPVKSQFKSYLGRPWKEYSRTVVMQSNIGDLIDPTGWSIWTGDFALKTLYYGEYMNKGSGAGTSKRVTWAGYHVITSATDAKPFTVAELIQGGSWLKSTGVSYTEGL